MEMLLNFFSMYTLLICKIVFSGKIAFLRYYPKKAGTKLVFTCRFGNNQIYQLLLAKDFDLPRWCYNGIRFRQVCALFCDVWVDRIVKTDPAAKNRSKVARKESRIDRRRVKVQVTEILGDKEFFCGVLICSCMFFYSSTLKEIKIEKPKEYEKLYLIY